jgi:hypothetical protein
MKKIVHKNKEEMLTEYDFFTGSELFVGPGIGP